MNGHKTALKRIFDYIGAYKWGVPLSLFLALITVVTTPYALILTGQAVNLIVAPGRVDFEGVMRILKRVALVICLTGISQWLINHLNNIITYRVVKDIRMKAFDYLEILPLRYIDGRLSGDVISRVIADVDQFSEEFLMGFTQLFTGVLTILGTPGFTFFINLVIAVVVVRVTPVSLPAASFIARKTYSMFKLQSETRGELTSLVDEVLGNQKVMQALGYEEEAQVEFEEVNERLRGSNLRAIFFSSITNPAIRFVSGLVYASVGTVGALAVVRGLLPVGQLTSFLGYVNQYTKSFNEISGVVTEFQNALASTARVPALIDEEPTPPDESDAVKLEKANGTVKMEDVFFSYNLNVKLIENLNLDVKPGQRIAIVGSTGCGKSTVTNPLVRFYDVDSGSIRVTGHDIRKVTRGSLRANYGMAPQETWLESGTIRDNIAYERPEASLDEVTQTAREAHAHSFIKRMSDGRDTMISEDGGNLSQGQKQLLRIVRVMLCPPPMLTLDEAISSINTRTEIRIQKALLKMMEGRTSFTVVHWLSTIREADVILVTRDGHIMEQGDHGDLLWQGGFYAELYNSQFAVSQTVGGITDGSAAQMQILWIRQDVNLTLKL